MISSIFYFADTEQEYLDNFNRHQVKPYTIVFCRDTRSLWKNGVRYGGSTASEVSDSIQNIVDQNIAPLLEQLDQAIDQANAAIDRAEDRITAASQHMDQAIANLNADIEAEKTRLNNKVIEINNKIDEEVGNILEDYQDLVDNFNDNVTDKIEDLMADTSWVEENFPQGVVGWQSSWDADVDARMQAAGYWDIDPETGEKTTKWSKLQQSVNNISSEVGDIVEGLGGDVSATYTKINQTANLIETTAQSVENINGRLSTAESTISQTPDAIVAAVTTASQTLNGNILTAKSEAILTASSIVQAVTGVTPSFDGSTYTITGNTLDQRITDEGTARTEMGTQWANTNALTQEVIEWMYSGLTTEAGDNKTFTELTAAAQDGDHSAISNIMNLVEKIPVPQIDPQSGEPITDGQGNPVYETDSNGNIIYQTNPDGSYKYKAKLSLTSAVDNALSGLMTEASANYASSLLFAQINSDIAGLKVSTGDTSALEGVVTKDNFASELKAVAAEDWALTALTSKLRVPKYDENGDPVYDEHGDPVYEEIADAIGSIQTRVSNIDGIENVTNTIDGRVGDALSTFEQQVTGQTASTTAVNKLGPALAGLVSKVTGDTSNASIVSKINGMSAGVVTTANLETAVAGLIARQEPIITLTATSIGAPPSGALNVYQGQAKSIPSEGVPSGPGASLTFSGTTFNTTFNTGLYHTTINTQVGPQETYVALRYEAGKSGLQSGSNPYYAISDGECLWTSTGLVIRIKIQDLSGAVFSKVDNKIGTATAGLAATSYVNQKAASILAEADEHMSQITLSADRINIDAQFVAALNAVAEFKQVIAQEVNAVEINANKIDANNTWQDENSNSYTSHTIVDGDGIRIYRGTSGWTYDASNEEIYNANIRLANDGEGWLANGHISWNGEGDTYLGPGDPEDGDDGIYVYDENGSTKIKLQGEIIADNFSLLSKQNQNKNGYFVNNGTYKGALYNGGFFVRLATDDYHYSRDLNDGVVPETDTNNPWTTADWGTIAIGSKNGTLPEPRGNNPVNKNDKDTYNQTLSPGVTLSVKGRDGYAYMGFTGTHNGMNYINGIAVGPADSGDTLFDKTFN